MKKPGYVPGFMLNQKKSEANRRQNQRPGHNILLAVC